MVVRAFPLHLMDLNSIVLLIFFILGVRKFLITVAHFASVNYFVPTCEYFNPIRRSVDLFSTGIDFF